MLLLWIKVDTFISIILPNLNPICHLLALGAHHILHVGRIRVKGRYSDRSKLVTDNKIIQHLNSLNYLKTLIAYEK
jgi:hypothetical protein